MTAPSYFRKIQKSENSLVADGKVRLGNFQGPFKTINPLEYNQLWGMTTPKWFRNMRLKEWQAFQLWAKDYFVFGAVYNAKLGGVVVFTIINTRTMEKSLVFQPVPAFKTKVANGFFNQISMANTSQVSLTIKNQLEQNRLVVEARNKVDSVSFNGTAFHIYEPLVTVMPFKKNRFVYTQKSLMPCEGTLKTGGKDIVFKRNEGLFMLDDHKGFYPRHLVYQWATAAWYEQNQACGFNLTQNQAEKPEEFSENCFWFQGRVFVLPPVTFKPMPEKSRWHITDAFGMVDLQFHFKWIHSFQMNLGLIKTNYLAPFGHFTGIIKNANQTLRVNHVFGMAEDKNYTI